MAGSLLDIDDSAVMEPRVAPPLQQLKKVDDSMIEDDSTKEISTEARTNGDTVKEPIDEAKIEDRSPKDIQAAGSNERKDPLDLLTSELSDWQPVQPPNPRDDDQIAPDSPEPPHRPNGQLLNPFASISGMINGFQPPLKADLEMELHQMMHRMLMVIQQNGANQYQMLNARLLFEKEELEGVLNKRDKEIINLKIELQNKNKKLRDFHQIILDNGLTDGGIDEEVNKRFGALYQRIQNVVNRHFANPQRDSSTGEFPAKENHIAWLQTQMAHKCYEHYFDSDIKMFGVDKSMDEHLQRFEMKLESQKVSYQDVRKWRTETIKAASQLDSPKKYEPAENLAIGITNSIGDFAIIANIEAAKHDVEMLFRESYDLALKLRGSKVRYEWYQAVDARRQDPSDVEALGPYDLRSWYGGNPKPVTMFGPVYKHSEGQPVLIRGGVILVNHQKEKR